jgi:Uncharacterized protein conserved in bacteria
MECGGVQLEKYIALLRGINVGGKNKVPMAELKKAFEAIGFSDVKTYINSGNVIFSSSIQNKSELVEKSERAIADKFGLNIPVVIVSVAELADVISHAPKWWNKNKEDVNYVVFPISPITVEEVFTAVGEIKPEYEKVSHYGGVIFWAAPLKVFTKTSWAKITNSAVNNSVTIRNANTVNKLLSLAE